MTTRSTAEVTDELIAEYVAKPYTRMLTPAEEGGYIAEVLEVPGAISQGETAEEAVAMVNDALGGIIAVMLEDGDKIPEPLGFNEYSGRFNLRISSETHRLAAMRAQLEGVSLNQWVGQAIAARLGPGALTSIGIQEPAEPGPFTVDATELWEKKPAPPRRRKTKKGSGPGAAPR